MALSPEWVSAGAAVAALVGTAIVAGCSFVQQRKQSTAALSEQRHLAEASLTAQQWLVREERLWDARSSLYVDLLVWVEERERRLRQLRQEVTGERLAAERAFLDGALLALSESLAGTEGPVPRLDDANLQAQARLERIRTIHDHLEPPTALRQRMHLYASSKVEKGFEDYRIAQTLPEVVAGAEPGPWADALAASLAALERFRTVVVEEIQELTAHPKGRPSAP